MRYLGREVEFVIKTCWFECIQLPDPKILPSKEGIPGLLLCQVFVGDFFDYYYSEVSVEVVVVFSKMAVDPQGISSMDIIPVFIYPLVCPLFFHFSDILLPIAFHTKCQVNRIFGPAIGPVPYFKSFAIGTGEKIR